MTTKSHAVAIEILREKEKVFNDPRYKYLKKDNKLTILHLVKNWVEQEIEKVKNQKQ